jgi:hypothetical protein
MTQDHALASVHTSNLPDILEQLNCSLLVPTYQAGRVILVRCEETAGEAGPADLTGPRYKFDSNSRLVIERKEDMKKRGIASPDEAEALGLTFAAPVSPAPKDWDPYAAFRNKRIF